ncbi:MAG: hypothetical protein HOV81_36675, partial [Kofleriaceae bacterium]|nr:hypothetical protein [Kofleriaceae bacterium]
MTDLSRSLLAAAREGLTPDAAVAARVRAKVAASIAAGAGAVGATTAASSATAATPAIVPAAASAGSKSLLLKLGALLLVGGAVTATVLATRERASDAPRLSMSSPLEVDEPRTVDRSVARDDNPRVTFEPAGSRARAPHRSIDPAAIEIDVPPPEPTAEPVSLSREVELIDLAMASLRKHAPAAALAAIRTYERETLGQGQMAEEAAAIAIEARCGLHQDVTDELAAFDLAWPSSAQRSRVVTTCFAKYPPRSCCTAARS